MSDKLKILFLPKYPVEGASSRYRVHQFIPFLESQGFECTVSAFYDSGQFARLMKGGGRIGKMMVMALAAFRRIGVALSAYRYDIVYMQREALPVGPLWLEKLFRAYGVKTVFDYDDALFLFKENRVTGFFNRFKQPDRIPAIMRHVDAVNASNDFLAQYAADHCGRVVNIPGVEDLQHMTPKNHDDAGAGVTVGWIGSPSTEYYLNLIADSLQKLARQVPGFRFVVIGGRNFSVDGVDVRHIPWTLAGEVPEVAKFDVGIMPLPDDAWSEGKSGGKARLYMALGVPAVVTGTGYNRELIADDETGVLIESPDEWHDALLAMCQDQPRRRRIGLAARAYVEKHLSLEVAGLQMATLFRELCGKRP